MNVLHKSFSKLRIKKLYFAAFLIFFAVYGFNLFQTGPSLPPADKDNGGLVLPGGFEAVVVVDSIGGGISRPRPAITPGRTPQGTYFGARHIGVNSNGDIYVKLR